MNKNKLLSILIPTKNRYNCLDESIKSILSIYSTDFEIIVQDNSDNNEEGERIIDEICDSRVRYFYTKESLSIIENCDLSVKNSKGEFLCMIGDDDSVSEKIIDVVMWMKKNNVDSCLSSPVKYFWKNIEFNLHKFPSLTILKRGNKNIKLDSKKELLKCLEKGVYELRNLPRVHHALISRKAMDTVFKLSGSYFPGPSPDMANAIALSLVVTKHYKMNIPFVISGHSPRSAGGMGTKGIHSGDIKSVKWLPKDTYDTWEENIPKVWTAQTIYAISAIKSLKRTGNILMLNKFNYEYSYAAFINYNPKMKSHLTNLKTDVNYFKVYFIYLFILIKRSKNYFFNFLETRIGITRHKIFKDIDTLREAVSIVNKFNEENNIKLNN